MVLNVASHIDFIIGNDYEKPINVDGIKKNICGHATAYNTNFRMGAKWSQENLQHSIKRMNFVKNFTPQQQLDEKMVVTLYNYTLNLNFPGKYLLHRLNTLERRKRWPRILNHSQNTVQYVREYLDLNHMVETSSQEIVSQDKNYCF